MQEYSPWLYPESRSFSETHLLGFSRVTPRLSVSRSRLSSDLLVLEYSQQLPLAHRRPFLSPLLSSRDFLPRKKSGSSIKTAFSSWFPGGCDWRSRAEIPRSRSPATRIATRVRGRARSYLESSASHGAQWRTEQSAGRSSSQAGFSESGLTNRDLSLAPTYLSRAHFLSFSISLPPLYLSFSSFHTFARSLSPFPSRCDAVDSLLVGPTTRGTRHRNPRQVHHPPSPWIEICNRGVKIHE